MTAIKWINAAVWVVADNIVNKTNNPPYICYDANRKEVDRCHSFSGTDCALVFEPKTEGSYPRVWLQVNGPITLDSEDVVGEGVVIVPSGRGIYSDPPQAIRIEDEYFSHVDVWGRYSGFYDVDKSPFMWITAYTVEGR